MSQLMQQTTQQAPVDGWAVESLLIGDCYERNLNKFTFFPQGKDKIKISIKLSEAFAINNFYSATSEPFNVLIRQKLEPKLPPCKPLENL